MKTVLIHSKMLAKGHTFLALLLFVFGPVAQVQGGPPELTAGGVPGNTSTITLGPTGLRGWVYSTGDIPDSGKSRQILVRTVDAGSPADGVLAADDVILPRISLTVI